MITLHDLDTAIAKCQGEANPNANTCIKLAAFYTIRQEKLEEIAQRYAKRFYGMERGDKDGFWFFTDRYAYCGVRQERGCSFPEALVIYRGNTELERIVLVK